MDNAMGAMPVYDVDGGKDGGFNSTWIWIFFLFFLLAWGGNGFGGFGGSANNAAVQGAITRADLYSGFDFNNLQRNILDIQNNLNTGFCNQTTSMMQGFNGVNASLCNGFNSVNNNIQQMRFDAQQCCCETNRNIDAIRYENARNNCDLIRAVELDGDKTRALITANEMQSLRDQLQTAKAKLDRHEQSSDIINTLRPTPIPSYITCSPFESTYVGRQGYGNYGCGCGTCN